MIDNNLSPQVAVLLCEAGHDVAHLRDYGMQAAPDEQVLDRARDEDMTDVILANLAPVAEDLTAGAIVVLGEDSVRIRRLPI